MTSKLIKGRLWTLAYILSFSTISAQLVSYNTNPLEAEIIYTDVENFIRAERMIKDGVDTTEIFQSEYIDKGTPGLKIFIEKYSLTAAKLTKAYKKNIADYKSLRNKLEWLKSQEDSIRKYFVKLNHFIPQAVFPPTYYLIDIRRGIGSGSIEGQLITIEKEAKNVIDPGLHAHIVHELVHLNQFHSIGSLEKYLAIYGEEKSLLAITIREGIAEFFAELVTGKYTQEEARKYVYSNEEKLWNKFKLEMYDTKTGDWMWKKPSEIEKPRDTGYVFGALIAEYFYKNSLNLDDATNTLLALTDYKTFINTSNYEKKFEELISKNN